MENTNRQPGYYRVVIHSDTKTSIVYFNGKEWMYDNNGNFYIGADNITIVDPHPISAEPVKDIDNDSKLNILIQIDDEMEREKVISEWHHPTGFYLGMQRAYKIIHDSLKLTAEPEAKEEKCGYCGPDGTIWNGDSSKICPHCKGSGYVQPVAPPVQREDKTLWYKKKDVHGSWQVYSPDQSEGADGKMRDTMICIVGGNEADAELIVNDHNKSVSQEDSEAVKALDFIAKFNLPLTAKDAIAIITRAKVTLSALEKARRLQTPDTNDNDEDIRI